MSDNANTGTPDYRDLLNKPMAEFPDMPNLPGLKFFKGKLVSMAAGHSRGENKTPLYHFEAKLTEPGKDVTESEMNALSANGFTLGDYTVEADFFLTPKAMPMLRRFLVSLGFPANVSFVENLATDQHGNPTQETQDRIRGKEVMIQTPRADDRGRVYLNRVTMTGTAAG